MGVCSKVWVRCLALWLTVFSGHGVSMAGPPKTYTNSQGMEFILIPAGSFMMGCDPNFENCSARERPRHRVAFPKPFYLGKTEVTQAQWVGVMGSNPSKKKGRDLPVERVMWSQAKSFCEKVGARLPTEAEWEYAARAGSSTAFYSGDITQTGHNPLDENLAAIGWYGGNSSNSPHRVGEKARNSWDLYDMSGNVWEWVWDRYCSDYEDYPSTDPIGEGARCQGSNRVTRGGSFRSSAAGGRCAYRIGAPPIDRFDVQGFRLSRSSP